MESYDNWLQSDKAFEKFYGLNQPDEDRIEDEKFEAGFKELAD